MRRPFLVSGAAVIVAALLVVPMPLVVLSPGAALSVPARIELVGQAEDQVSGDLLLTTVRVSEPSAVETVVAWLDGRRSVVARQQVIPPGVDADEYVEAQRQLYRESAQLAAAVGLRAAGFPAEVTGAGARVAGVIEGSPAEGRLREGDVITAINDWPVLTAADVAAVTARATSGDLVRVRVQRGDEARELRIVVDEVSRLGRPGLGVALRTVAAAVRLPFPVEVAPERIGGESAGLMTALAVYDLVDPGDLARGRRVAGTGTIDGRGRVGPVGGVAEKVAAAERADAVLFLVPRAEADLAKRAAGPRLRVVPVDTFDDALAALRR
ncbi:MAG: PDZ domain-containing protein [Actinomycetota bacterium]|nr:PDZ domain-containing protein [Actinomycetota bacterium]